MTEAEEGSWFALDRISLGSSWTCCLSLTHVAIEQTSWCYHTMTSAFSGILETSWSSWLPKRYSISSRTISWARWARTILRNRGEWCDWEILWWSWWVLLAWSNHFRKSCHLCSSCREFDQTPGKTLSWTASGGQYLILNLDRAERVLRNARG